MKARKDIAWSALALAVVAVLISWGWRRQTLWENQIRNTVVFNDYRSALHTFQGVHQGFPVNLDELPFEFRNIIGGTDCDFWGFPLVYESNGSGYILVSSGRSGEFAVHDYWQLREAYQDSNSTVDICMKWAVDQIASDRGWHYVCGK